MRREVCGDAKYTEGVWCMADWMRKPFVALGMFGLGMGFIPLNDALIKIMSDHLSLAQIVFLRGLLAFLIVVVFFAGLRHTMTLPARVFWSFVGRSMCLVLAMALYFIPLGSMPIATAVSIFFVSPLLITLLAVPFLGERIGVHRLVSVCMGLVGVLVIIQPGTEEFRPESILVFGSALSYAFFQVWTRHLKSVGSLPAMVTVQQLCYMGAAVPLLLYNFTLPLAPSGNATFDFLLRAPEMLALREMGFLVICTLAVLFLSLVSANVYRNVEASIVAPIEYVAIPFSVLWGVIIWGDWPQASGWVGMTLIIGGGVYTVYRERERKVRLVSGIPIRGHAAVPGHVIGEGGGAESEMKPRP